MTVGAAETSFLVMVREAAGLSQQELATRSGVSVRTISNIERGEVSRPRRGSLDALADALALTPEQRSTLIRHYRDEQPMTSLDAWAGRNFLPCRVPGFTGRVDEVQRVLDLLDAAPDAVVCSVDGMAGVGKTSFAVHVGHALAARFPDGQLFVDLHGFTPGERPLEPEAALGVLLRQLGVPGEKIPAELMDRAALWRQEMAGRRAVVVLDNAATDGQVGPLLPGAAESLVLVTSRRRLSGLDAVPISLDTLPPDDAKALFAQVAGVNPADEPLEDVVARCGFLPLAIRIAAARLRHRPAWTTRHLISRLGTEGDVLAELSTGGRDVAAAFAVSYEQLEPRLRRAFRLLGGQPMATFDSHATAALLDVPLAVADQMLEELLDVHLIEQAGPGRYQFHDLLKHHARIVGDGGEERDAGLRGLLDYLLHGATEAKRVLSPHRRQFDTAISRVPAAPAEVSGSRHAALRWLEAERANLLAAIEAAAERGLDAHTWQLTVALTVFFEQRGHADDWIASHEIALAAARRARDPIGESAVLSHFSWAMEYLGRHAAASEFAERAVAVAVAADDRFAEGVARDHLGMVQLRLGDYDAAERTLRAATLPESAGQPNEVRLLNMMNMSNLGWICDRTGRYQEALRYYSTSAELAAQLTDLEYLARAKRLIGLLNARLGDLGAGLAEVTASLELFRAIGSRRLQGWALAALGRLRTRSGEPAAGAESLAEALAVLRELDDRRGQAVALADLGVANVRLSRHDEALRQLDEARALSRQVSAVELYPEILNHTADALLAAGRTTDSAATHRQALDEATTIGIRYEAARAHQGLARCAEKSGDAPGAAEHDALAAALWTELGVPPAP